MHSFAAGTLIQGRPIHSDSPATHLIEPSLQATHLLQQTEVGPGKSLRTLAEALSGQTVASTTEVWNSFVPELFGSKETSRNAAKDNSGLEWA
jgi:hypothetical protein